MLLCQRQWFQMLWLVLDAVLPDYRPLIGQSAIYHRRVCSFWSKEPQLWIFLLKRPGPPCAISISFNVNPNRSSRVCQHFNRLISLLHWKLENETQQKPTLLLWFSTLLWWDKNEKKVAANRRKFSDFLVNSKKKRHFQLWGWILM